MLRSVFALCLCVLLTHAQYVPAGSVPPAAAAAAPTPTTSTPPAAAPAAATQTPPPAAATVPTPAAATPSTPSGTPVSTVTSSSPTPPRFALRHSFRPPYQRSIPFWNAGAGAFVNETYVRITPAKQSRTGFLWNTVPIEMKDWQVEMEFAVSGMKQLGGDGFALWFVDKPELLGTVYGSADYWNGLGLFFDTFNNDNVGSNPLISAIYNDGTQRFDYTSDGATQALSSCSFDFRNHDSTSFAKLNYKDGKLSVDIAIHRSVTDGTPMYQPCLSVNVELGVDKFFGITAHTGDVADNHDIHSFVVSDQSPATVDLQKVRAHYTEQLSQQQAKPDHQEMTVPQFQHSVLTTLSQIQGEVNLLEIGQLAMSDYLHSQFVVPLQAAAAKPAAATPDTPATTTTTAPAAVPTEFNLNPATALKIDTVHDNQNKVLQEINKLSSTVQTLAVTMNRPSTPGQPAAAPPSSQGSAPDNSVLNAAVQSIDTNVKQIQTTLQALTKKNDELNSLLNNVIRTQSQQGTLLQQAITNLAASTNGVAPDVPSAAHGIGWFAYGLIMFCVVCIASLTFHTFRQHMKKERYKLV